MTSTSATIKIDLDRGLGSVDPRIFGGFIEHLGRCIYGGIYDEESPLSGPDGVRTDVLKALEPLGLPVLRWPGGNFVSGYHWLDGVGPKDARPRRLELAWGAEESNRFGTDEFMAYCDRLGAEPYLCINMGTGTIDEAQAWIEYCNGVGNTSWANLRRANGHEDPYRVRYWGLGNEMYGDWQIGALGAKAYAARARELAKVMRRTDPDIKLVSCGQDGMSEWDRVVLEELASDVDFHSIHLYTGAADYWQNVLAPLHAERALDHCRAMIDNVRYRQKIDHPVTVAYDEWNVWYREKGEDGLEETYTLADALAVATYLNVFIRQCATVKMANLAQMVNVIAPIVTRPDGLFLQTIYHPFRLYSELMLERSLEVHLRAREHHLVEASEANPWPHRVADLGPFPVLDVAATCDAGRHRLAVGIVNRSLDAAIGTELRLADGVVVGDVVAHEVAADSWELTNSFEEPNTVGVRSFPLHADGSVLEHILPAHSVTVVTATLKGAS